MITLKSYERTPSLAELKVSYRRGRPRSERQQKMPFVVSSPVSCEEYLRTVWDKNTIELREEFLVICLNASHEVLGWVRLATGSLDSVNVDPRLVFGVALQTASAAIIVAHNHPSDSTNPSTLDRWVTRRLRDAGDILGVKLLDHVILTRNGYFSFAVDEEWR